MNKEWLIDYEAREIENYGRFVKEFQKTGKIEYPPKSRFGKLKYPIVDTSSEIWSVIPFYGSSFIHVFPSKRESTIETCGWGTDKDINNLIQMAKDTGRVQFILDRGPLDFEHYDYLEPILRELQPPVREIMPDSLFNEKEFKKAEAEFTTLSDYKFVPFLKRAYNHYRALDSIPSLTFENFYHGYVTKYATLRLSGYDEIADTILNSLVDDPALAWHYSHLYGALLADPIHSCFKLTYNPIASIGAQNLGYITNEISNLSPQPSIATDLNKMTLCDVGQSLFQKLTLGADGYLGCQALIDKYEQQDTHKLLVSIHEGLRTKRIDILQSSASELSEVLDNIWNDRKISKLSSGISFGMPLLLGTVGPLVAQSIGGASGILAGLGFRVFDKTITPVMTKTISKGLARVFKNDYLLAIYDFKKKYGIGT